jgi:hypothetical protein
MYNLNPVRTPGRQIELKTSGMEPEQATPISNGFQVQVARDMAPWLEGVFKLQQILLLDRAGSSESKG